MFMENMNISGLCKRPEVFMFPWTIQKFYLLLILTFYYKYLKCKNNIFNLGIKTILYLEYNRINCLVGV